MRLVLAAYLASRVCKQVYSSSFFSVSAVHEGLCQAQALVGHGGQTQPPTLLGVGVFIVVTAFLLV